MIFTFITKIESIAVENITHSYKIYGSLKRILIRWTFPGMYCLQSNVLSNPRGKCLSLRKWPSTAVLTGFHIFVTNTGATSCIRTSCIVFRPTVQPFEWLLYIPSYYLTMSRRLEWNMNDVHRNLSRNSASDLTHI